MNSKGCAISQYVWRKFLKNASLFLSVILLSSCTYYATRNTVSEEPVSSSVVKETVDKNRSISSDNLVIEPVGDLHKAKVTRVVCGGLRIQKEVNTETIRRISYKSNINTKTGECLCNKNIHAALEIMTLGYGAVATILAGNCYCYEDENATATSNIVGWKDLQCDKSPVVGETIDVEIVTFKSTYKTDKQGVVDSEINSSEKGGNRGGSTKITYKYENTKLGLPGEDNAVVGESIDVDIDAYKSTFKTDKQGVVNPDIKALASGWYRGGPTKIRYRYKNAKLDLLIDETQMQQYVSPETPRLVVKGTVKFVDGLRGGVLYAGTSGKILVEVSNEGKGTAWDVVLKVTGNKLKGVDYNGEFSLGHILTGKKYSLEIPVSAGFDVSDGRLDLTLQAEAKYNKSSVPVSISPGIAIKSLDRPRLLIADVRVKPIHPADGRSNKDVAQNDETVDIVVKVSNDGVGKAEGVLLRLDSVPPDLTKLVGEAKLGTIAQNGLVEGVLSVRIPRLYDPGKSSIPLEISARDSRPISEEVRRPINLPYQFQSPKLHFTELEVFDGDPNTNSTGNGNHIIEQGEQIELRVAVVNQGVLPAEDVVVSLSSDRKGDGVTTTPGEVAVGKIPPGERKVASFQLDVPGGASLGGITLHARARQKDFQAAEFQFAKEVRSAGAVVAKAEVEQFQRVSNRPNAFPEAGSTESLDQVPFYYDYRRPSNFAVIIGIDRYKEKGIVPLPYAGADSRSVRDYLVNIGGFPKENVRLLTGEEATLGTIRTYLKWLRQNATIDGIALVYFSGHGIADLSQKGEPYLLPYDGDRSAVEETAWPLTDIKKMMTIVDPAKVVALIDACYTGEGRSFSAPDARPGVVRVRDSGGVGGAGLLLAASQADQPSWDYPASGHGLFTWALLKGLRGAAVSEDGFVYPDRLFDYLKREVPPLSKRLKGVEQTPVMTGVPWKVPLTKAVR